MAHRFTKADIEHQFEGFCKLMDRRVARSWNDVGAWGLDYNPTYGGWIIYEIVGKDGGQSHPFLSTRHRTAEFWSLLHFARIALQRKAGYRYLG